MLTIKETIEDSTSIDEDKLVKISDKLWEIGSLEDIKGKVNSELFTLHVGINLVGNWKADGWGFIICELADFVRYIPETLEALNLPELKHAFENVIQIFPEHTVFKSNDASYYEICNFMQSFSAKVNDEKLKTIDFPRRKEMVKQFRQKLDILEELTEQFWKDNAECGGWKQIVEYCESL